MARRDLLRIDAGRRASDLQRDQEQVHPLYLREEERHGEFTYRPQRSGLHQDHGRVRPVQHRG